MSEKLTDERLDELLALRPGLSLNRESVAELHAMAAELRSIRAAALTNRERMALVMMRRDLGSSDHFDGHEWFNVAMAALDRLLAAAEVKP